MKVLEIFFAVIAVISASTTLSCINKSAYQVKECDDHNCDPNSMKVGICEKEGQLLQLGGKENIICQSPAKICGSLETELSNNRILVDDNETSVEDNSTTIEEMTTPSETKIPLPTSFTPSTHTPSDEIPIEIPKEANETISIALKQVQEITKQLINSGVMKPTETSVSAQRAARKEYEKLPIPTEKSTKDFIDLMQQTQTKTVKFENIQSIDMTNYNKNIKLEDSQIDGNSNELVIQPKKKSNSSSKERRYLQNSEEMEEKEEESTIQLFDESNNIVYENSKINIISRESLSQNKPIIIQNCNGIFKSLKNSIIRNVEVIIYNDIIFNCQGSDNNNNDYGLFTNIADNVTFINVKIIFNYDGIRTISINSNISSTIDFGLLAGESKDSSINNIQIYGNIITVKGEKDKQITYGNLIGLNTNSNINNCYIDLSFVLLYQNIVYGGIVGVYKGDNSITDSYVYLSSGLRVGVDENINQFIYGGLIGKNESGKVNIVNDWISLNVLGIEINSENVNFGGIIGVGEVSITKSSLKMIVTQSKFYIKDITTDNKKCGYVIGDDKEIDMVNSTINYESCNSKILSDCISPILSYKAGNSSYPTKKAETRILTSSIQNNYVFGNGINTEDYKDGKIINTPPSDYCNDGILENGICYYTKYTPTNRPQVQSYLIISTEGMNSKIASNSKLVCPNKCNLNGICQYGECLCFPGFTSYDCRLRTCPYGTAISNPTNGYDKDDRVNYECSNQGKCNRENGLCECFAGYEGNACQRTKCPNQCSNHGVCTTVNEAILYKDDNLDLNYNKKYGKWDRESIQLCVCDKEYSGVDCSIRKCPKGYLADSECDSPSQGEIKVTYSSNDISQIKADNSDDKYLVYLKYTDPNNHVWFTSSFAFHLRDEWLKALGSLPSYAISIEGVEIDKETTNTAFLSVTITFSKHQTGRQYPIEVIGTKEMKEIPELRDAKNGFYHWLNPNLHNLLDTENGKITYEMENTQRGYECSNNGICNTQSGVCNCFDGFSGLACSEVEETV